MAQRRQLRFASVQARDARLARLFVKKRSRAAVYFATSRTGGCFVISCCRSVISWLSRRTLSYLSAPQRPPCSLIPSLTEDAWRRGYHHPSSCSRDMRNTTKRLAQANTTAFALICICLMASVHAAPSLYPTGATRYDPSRAFNSFVLFTGADNIAHLIDLEGNAVHEWKDAGNLSTLLDPALTGNERGHVLVTLETIDGRGTDLVPGQVTGRVSKRIGELDWDGKPVWEFGATPYRTAAICCSRRASW